MIYHHVFSETVVSLIWSSYPVSRTRMRDPFSLGFPASNGMGILGTCQIVYDEAIPLFCREALFVLKVDSPHPSKIINTLNRKFWATSTELITRISINRNIHVVDQYAEDEEARVIWDDNDLSGLEFSFHQVNYWPTIFPALKEVRLLYPALALYHRNSTSKLSVPADVECATLLLNKLTLLVETEHSEKYDGQGWQDLGASVHQVVLHSQPATRSDMHERWMLALIPFDDRSWKIASLYDLDQQGRRWPIKGLQGADLRFTESLA
ncbi:MAG: hypothetical protein Q9166_007145 [cf. Caloplaca sp. 2 TL-2023]